MVLSYDNTLILSSSNYHFASEFLSIYSSFYSLPPWSPSANLAKSAI